MTTKAKAAVKAKSDELPTVVDQSIDDVATEETATVELVDEQGQPKRQCNVLLQKFTSEDIENKHPRLYERFYRTFEPMGIANDRNAVNALMDDYFEWMADAGKRIAEKQEQDRQDAIAKINALAEKMGIDLASI